MTSKDELIDLLTAYLIGWKTLWDCSRWLAGIDWDDSAFSPDDQKLAGLLELLTTEVIEGLRPEDEFAEEASRLVEKEAGINASNAAW